MKKLTPLLLLALSVTLSGCIGYVGQNAEGETVGNINGVPIGASAETDETDETEG